MERITMFIQLKFDSEVPIYEQIKQQIKIGMAKGTLQPGERLPSVRQLAKDIGINLHTVNKAYKQLEEEDILTIHRQQGVIINPDGPPVANDDYIKKLEASLLPIIAHTKIHKVNKQQLLKLINTLYDELGGDGNN